MGASVALRSAAQQPRRIRKPGAARRWDLARDRSDWRAVLAANARETLRELAPAAARLRRVGLDGEDLVAEAFERVMRLWAAGRGPRQGVHGYLVNSMRNRVVDELRSPRSAVVVGIPDGYVAPSTLGDPERELERAEVRAALQEALRRLPEASREMLLETCVQGRKVSEVAEALGVPADIVSQRVYRAKRELRRILDEDPRVR